MLKNELALARDNKALSQAERISKRPVIVPPARIIEDKDNVILSLDVPGAFEKSLDLTIEKNTLHVFASRNEPEKEKSRRLYFGESRNPDYERAFILSQEIDRDKISAVFKNGVLTITLPKGAYAKTKKIKVVTN